MEPHFRGTKLFSISLLLIFVETLVCTMSFAKFITKLKQILKIENKIILTPERMSVSEISLEF